MCNCKKARCMYGLMSRQLGTDLGSHVTRFSSVGKISVILLVFTAGYIYGKYYLTIFSSPAE
jgi:hypothetical protein